MAFRLTDSPAHVLRLKGKSVQINRVTDRMKLGIVRWLVQNLNSHDVSIGRLGDSIRGITEECRRKAAGVSMSCRRYQAANDTKAGAGTSNATWGSVSLAATVPPHSHAA